MAIPKITHKNVPDALRYIDENGIPLLKEIEYYASDILRSDNMLMTTKFIQHGEVSVYAHSLMVATSCLKFADKMHIKVDRCSLVRGALLHDYFLYDWHESPKKCRPHGFTHAKTALMNAKRDFEINEIEAEMIYCHMFPMNILRVPKHRESIILCLADKAVSSYETIKGFKRILKVREP